jgi:short-subunit dehydrogenase involved in D-alanine esterification of teichoic acids
MTFTTSAKCVLVIGATSGIGRYLALAIHELPSKPTVIVAGRRQARLDEIIAQGSKAGKENLHAVTVDMTSDLETQKSFVKDTLTKFPEVSLFFNASSS